MCRFPSRATGLRLARRGADTAGTFRTVLESCKRRGYPDVKGLILLWRRDRDFRAGLTYILHQPWWRRLWASQEVHHAKMAVAQCGIYQINWHTLATVYSVVADDSHALGIADGRARHHLAIADRCGNMGTGLGYDAVDVLRFCSRRECSDDRDHVHGLVCSLSSPIYCPTIRFLWSVSMSKLQRQ